MGGNTPAYFITLYFTVVKSAEVEATLMKFNIHVIKNV